MKKTIIFTTLALTFLVFGGNQAQAEELNAEQVANTLVTELKGMVTETENYDTENIENLLNKVEIENNNQMAKNDEMARYVTSKMANGELPDTALVTQLFSGKINYEQAIAQEAIKAQETTKDKALALTNSVKSVLTKDNLKLAVTDLFSSGNTLQNVSSEVVVLRFAMGVIALFSLLLVVILILKAKKSGDPSKAKKVKYNRFLGSYSNTLV